MTKFTWVSNKSKNKYSKEALISDEFISLDDLRTLSGSKLLNTVPGTIAKCGICHQFFTVQENIFVKSSKIVCYSCIENKS